MRAVKVRTVDKANISGWSTLCSYAFGLRNKDLQHYSYGISRRYLDIHRAKLRRHICMFAVFRKYFWTELSKSVQEFIEFCLQCNIASAAP